MKLRKLAILLVSALSSNLILADSNVHDCNLPFSGWYGGLFTGTTQIQSQNNASVLGNFAITAFSANSAAKAAFFGSYKADEFRNSYLGGLDIGYGKSFLFYPNLLFNLGLEGYVNGLTPRELTSHLEFGYQEFEQPPFTIIKNVFNFVTPSKVKFNPFEFGIDFKPGIAFLSGTLLYGRIGAAFNELKLDANSSASMQFLFPSTVLFVANGNLVTSLSLSNKENVGLRLGAGIEEYLSPCLSLHADYIYTDYRKIRASGVTNSLGFGTRVIVFPFIFLPVIVTPNGYVANSSVDVHNQTFLLGLNYHLDPYLFNAPSIDCPPCFDGFYLGLRGGLTIVQGDDFNTATTINANEIFIGSGGIIQVNQPHTGDLYRNEVTGSAFVGYGEKLGCSPFYLSAEGYFKDLSSNLNVFQSTVSVFDFSGILFGITGVNSLTTATKLSISSDSGVDFRPGVFLDNKTLLYGRIGLAYNNLKIRSFSTFNLSERALISLPPASVTSTFRTFKEKNVEGLRLGAGLEEYISNNFSVTADYVYTNYGTINSDNAGPVIGLISTFIPTVNPVGYRILNSAKVTSQEVSVGLIYHIPVKISFEKC